MNKTSVVALAALVVAVVAGCDNKPATQAMPEVNDENCLIENIKKIADKTTRERFAGQCSRRTIGIAPTEKAKNWLELSDPKK